MEKNTKAKIKTILNDIKGSHWMPGYQEQVTDAQAMGILMAHYFEWDGQAILKATYEGLEDSNFHTENKTIERLMKSEAAQLLKEQTVELHGLEVTITKGKDNVPLVLIDSPGVEDEPSGPKLRVRLNDEVIYNQGQEVEQS